MSSSHEPCRNKGEPDENNVQRVRKISRRADNGENKACAFLGKFNSAMGQSALNRFPPELVKTVVDNLPRADLPAARFLNEQFSSIAAPRLFSSVPLWISINSLQNLADLAAHSHLRGYVQEIVFSPLRLIDYKDENKYLSRVKTCLEYGCDSVTSTALHYGRHRSAYRAFIDAQRYLSEGWPDLCSPCCSSNANSGGRAGCEDPGSHS